MDQEGNKDRKEGVNRCSVKEAAAERFQRGHRGGGLTRWRDSRVGPIGHFSLMDLTHEYTKSREWGVKGRWGEDHW